MKKFLYAALAASLVLPGAAYAKQARRYAVDVTQRLFFRRDGYSVVDVSDVCFCDYSSPCYPR